MSDGTVHPMREWAVSFRYVTSGGSVIARVIRVPAKSIIDAIEIFNTRIAPTHGPSIQIDNIRRV